MSGIEIVNGVPPHTYSMARGSKVPVYDPSQEGWILGVVGDIYVDRGQLFISCILSGEDIVTGPYDCGWVEEGNSGHVELLVG